MKRCPECRRDYYDDSLLYCLEDGASLIQGAVPSPDEPQTVILHETAPPSEAAKRSHIHTTEQTAILPSGITEVPKRGLNRRVLAATLLLAIIVSGGFIAYKYVISSSGQIDSIAVLPFENRSESSDTDYLSDGLAESLIYRFSQLPDLKVSPTSSVMRYKGKGGNLGEIARELGVRAVMTGKVVQRGENLTISIELIDVPNNKLLWGEQYERKMADLLAIQREIAGKIIDSLQIKLSGVKATGITKQYTENNEAYQLYLKGLFHWNKRTPDDLNKAIEYFTQAKEIDPSFALAFVGLALTYSVLPSNSALTKEQAEDAGLRAKAAARRALELDDSLAEAHAVLANKMVEDWDFAGAESAYKKAIELNPNYATAHQWYSDLLERLGRIDDALMEIRKAYELDPFSTAINMNLALRYYSANRVDEAEAQFKKTIEMAPDYPNAYFYLSGIYFDKGMYEESLATGSKGDILYKLESPETSQRKTAELREALRAGGKKAYIRKSLEYEMELYKKGVSSPALIAGIHAELGETDKAFEWLEKGFLERDFLLTYIKPNRRFDSIRSDQRYQNLLARIGLPR